MKIEESEKLVAARHRTQNTRVLTAYTEWLPCVAQWQSSEAAQARCPGLNSWKLLSFSVSSIFALQHLNLFVFNVKVEVKAIRPRVGCSFKSGHSFKGGHSFKDEHSFKGGHSFKDEHSFKDGHSFKGGHSFMRLGYPYKLLIIDEGIP